MYREILIHCNRLHADLVLEALLEFFVEIEREIGFWAVEDI